MIKKFLLVAGGTLSVVLGVIGLFLPVLPTTPFLLLAAYCYVRSSPRLLRWLMNQRILGTYLQNYLKYRAISKAAKIGALIALWVSLSVSIAVINSTAVRIILLLVGIGVSTHLLLLKTMPKETPESGDCEHKSRKTDNQ